MKKKIALLAALCVSALAAYGVAAPAAMAGCVAVAGGTGWLPISAGHPEPRWDGAAAINCTTNNGDWYDIEYYFDAYRSGTWSALPRTHQSPVNNAWGPGAPLKDGFASTSHYQVECGFVSPLFGVSPYTQIRTEAILHNQRTGSVSHVVGAAQVIDTTGEFNCANGIGN